jgi:hypothetical protein
MVRGCQDNLSFGNAASAMRSKSGPFGKGRPKTRLRVHPAQIAGKCQSTMPSAVTIRGAGRPDGGFDGNLSERERARAPPHAEKKRRSFERRS